MATNTLFTVKPGQGAAVDKYLKQLITQINSLNDAVSSISLSNAIDPKQVEMMKKSLTSVSKQVQTIAEQHANDVTKIAKAAAVGMGDNLTKLVSSDAITKTHKNLVKLQEDLAKTSKNNSTGQTTKEVDQLVASIGSLSDQVQQFQDTSGQLQVTLANINDLYGQMQAGTEGLATGYSKIADHTDVIDQNISSANTNWQRLSKSAESDVGFKAQAQAMDDFNSGLDAANSGVDDLYGKYGDVNDVIAEASANMGDLSAPFDDNSFSQINDAAQSAKALADASGEIGSNLSGAGSDMGGLSGSSQGLEKIFTSIAASVSSLPEMLRAMKSLVMQSQQYSKEVNNASVVTSKNADTWQRTVLDAVATRQATIETADAVKRIFGPEVAGSVEKLQQSVEFTDEYMTNIYRNAELTASLNESLGYEAFKAASGSSYMMGSLQISKHLLLDQKSMIGRARVMQMMAKETIAKNNSEIKKIQDQYDAVSKKISGASDSREHVSRNEIAEMEAQQAGMKAQQAQLELDNKRVAKNEKFLGIVNKITGAVQSTGAAFGIGEKANEKRLDLMDKMEWAEKATAEKAWETKDAADGLAKTVGQVELKSRNVNEYWAGIQANFKGSEGAMSQILEGGLAGSIKQATLIITAQNLIKQQNSMADRISVQRFIRQERARGSSREIDKLEGEWKGINQALTDHNKGYINLTEKEFRNLKFRQKVIDTQRKALQAEVAQGKGNAAGGIIEKAAYTISTAVNAVGDVFKKTDKAADRTLKLRKQLLNMEEQSDRLSRQTGKRNESLAAQLLSSYDEQATANTTSATKIEDMQTIYANIESTSAKILESWQKMFDMFAQMNGMAANDPLSLGVSAKMLDREADGLEAIVNKIAGANDQFKNVFSPDLIQQWGKSVGKSFTSIQDVIEDPAGFEKYEDKILEMLTRMVQSISGLSKEAAEKIANDLIPSLEEVKKVAETGGKVGEKGYFYQKEEASAHKTRTGNRVINATAGARENVKMKNGPLSPEDMAKSISKNADRLSSIFSEEFVKSLNETFPDVAKKSYKTFDEFINDPAAYNLDVRNSAVQALAQQFQVLNGESSEFNYALAHKFLPTLDEVKDSVGKGEVIDIKGLVIRKMEAANPGEARADLINSIMETKETPGENKLLMLNKGLPKRDYMIDQVKSYQGAGLRDKKADFDKSHGLSADVSAYKAKIEFYEQELEKINVAFDKSIQESATGAADDALVAEKKRAEGELQAAQAEMQAVQEGVKQVDTTGMTGLQKLFKRTEHGFNQLRSAALGIGASIQESKIVNNAVDAVTSMGRESKEIAQLTATMEAAEKGRDDVMQIRYKQLADAQKTLSSSVDASTGTYSQQGLTEFLTKIQAIPTTGAATIQSTADASAQALKQIQTVMAETTDPNKLQVLTDLANEQRQNIEDYKMMVQQKKGFDSGTASQWQNRVGQIQQGVQEFGQTKEGLMNTNFADSIGNNFDQLQGKLLELGSSAKVGGGLFKFLGENLGGVMAVLQGVNIGFDVFDRLMGKSPEQIRKYNESIQKINQTIGNIASNALSATASTGQQSIQALQDQLLQANTTVSLTQHAALKMTGGMDTLRTLGEKFLVGTTTLYGESGKAYQEALSAKKDIEKQLMLTKASKYYIDQIAAVNRTVDNALQALQSLGDLEAQIVQSQFEYNKQKLADQKDFEKQTKRDAEQKAMDLLYAQEDWGIQRVNAYKDNLKAIADIEKDYGKTIKDSDKEMNDARLESYESLKKSMAQGDKEYAKSVAENETQYQDSQYDSQKEFIKSMLQSQQDYAKERMRAEQDLKDQLFDLEMSNDVLGYLTAQRDAAKEKARSDEDHNKEMADNKKQNEETRAENQKAHELELADLQEQNAQSRLEQVTSYLEEQQQRQKEHDKSMEQLQKDTQERLDEQVKGYAQSEAEAWNQLQIDQEREAARTALSKRYAEEDRQQQLQQNEQSFKDQMLQYQQQEDVAKKQLSDYYYMLSGDREEADRKAQEQIDGFHNTALSDLGTHGVNMAKVGADNAVLMIGIENTLGEERFKAASFWSQKMQEELDKIGTADLDNKGGGTGGAPNGSLLDNVGSSLSGIVAGAGYLASLGNEQFAGDIWKFLRGAAKGGDFDAGEVIMVGEEGPELFVPHATGTIIPHELSKKIAEQGGLKAFAAGTSNVRNTGVSGGFASTMGGSMAAGGFMGGIGRGGNTGVVGPGKKGGPGRGSRGPGGIFDQNSDDPAHGRGFVPPKRGPINDFPGIPGGSPGNSPDSEPGGSNIPQAGGTTGTTAPTSNMSTVDWSTGKPVGSGGQQSTTVEVMPSSPDLVVSDFHYQTAAADPNATPADTTDWAKQLAALGPGRDKLADTKKRIEDIQNQFQSGWVKITDTNKNYQTQIKGFDKSRLEDLYDNTYSTYAQDLKTRREFADKMIKDGKTYNMEAWTSQQSFLDDSVKAQAGASGKQLEIYADLFKNIISSLTGGKVDALAVIQGLSTGATDLLGKLNVDGTSTIGTFVNKATDFLKGLFGSSNAVGDAAKDSTTANQKTQQGMSGIFDSILNFAKNAPDQIGGVVKAGVDFIAGKSPEFAAAFKAMSDSTSQATVTTQKGMGDIFGSIVNMTKDVPAKIGDLTKGAMDLLGAKTPEYLAQLKTTTDAGNQSVLDIQKQFLADMGTQQQTAADTQTAAEQAKNDKIAELQKQIDDMNIQRWDTEKALTQDGTDDQNQTYQTYWDSQKSLMHDGTEQQTQSYTDYWAGMQQAQLLNQDTAMKTSTDYDKAMGDAQKNYQDNSFKMAKAYYDSMNQNIQKYLTQMNNLISMGFTQIQAQAVVVSTAMTGLGGALVQFTNAVTAAANQIIATANSVMARANSGSSGSSSGSGSHSGSGGGLGNGLGLLGYGGGRAGGGGVDSSHGYLVGEKGPEWFRPHKPGSIVNYASLGSGSMNIIPQGYDKMMANIKPQQQPSYGSYTGTNMSLRIENLHIGSDISRSEIESQLHQMGMTIVHTISGAVG